MRHWHIFYSLNDADQPAACHAQHECVLNQNVCLIRAAVKARAWEARCLRTLKLLLILGLLLRSPLQRSKLLLQARLLALGLRQRLRCCGARLGCGLGGSCMLLLQSSQRCCYLGLLSRTRCQLRGQVTDLPMHDTPLVNAARAAGSAQEDSPTLVPEYPASQKSRDRSQKA